MELSLNSGRIDIVRAYKDIIENTENCGEKFCLQSFVAYDEWLKKYQVVEWRVIPFPYRISLEYMNGIEVSGLKTYEVILDLELW